MSYGYSKRSTDGNQASIAEDLRGVGIFVWDTHTQSKGFPDLLAYNRALDRWVPLEVKLSERENLTPAEKVWWQKAGVEPIVVWDTRSAFKAVGVETMPFDDPVERIEPVQVKRRRSGRPGGRKRRVESITSRATTLVLDNDGAWRGRVE